MTGALFKECTCLACLETRKGSEVSTAGLYPLNPVKWLYKRLLPSETLNKD